MAVTQPGPVAAAHASAASMSSPAHVMGEADGEAPSSHSLQPSSFNSYRTSARSRTRSVGADVLQGEASTSRPAMREKRESYRGPGTPDISLHDAFSRIKSSPEGTVDKELYEARQDSKKEGHTRKRSLTDASSTSSPVRPRLTSQLRSFFTSFRTEKTDENDKDRSSEDGQDEIQKGSVSQRQKLVMPAARPAGSQGLSGFNADSPPLTPSSDEARELDSREDEAGDVFNPPHAASHQRHHWATAQALADGAAAAAAAASGDTLEFIDRTYTPSSTTTTMSSRMSDSSSPIYPSLSRASSTNTYIPSRPLSSMSMLKMATPSDRSGILPSHSITPTGSPTPPEGATTAYLHANTPSFSSVATLRMSSMLSTQQLPNLRPHLPAMFFLLTAFIGSTICVLLALSTLPLTLPHHITDLTLAEIRDMSLQLQTYSRSSNKAFAHTLAVLGFFFTWKQSFTIPGSLIMNVVFGAMYGTILGTFITSVLTAVGGVFCYLLVAPLGSLIRKMPFLNKVLAKMQNAMLTPSSSTHHQAGPASSLPHAGRKQTTNSRGKGGNIWTYLLVLRVLPIVPYGLMNIACAVLRVPLMPYAATLALGSIPWNFCTVQVGDLLVQVVSALDESSVATSSSLASSLDADGFHNVARPGAAGLLGDQVRVKAESAVKAISAKVWNKEMLLKLLLMSMVSLAPMLLQRWLRRKESEEELDSVTTESRTMSEVDDREDNLDMQHEQAPASSTWRSSWTCPNAKRLSAAVDYSESRHSKRLSEAWIEGVVSIEERLRAANRSAAPADPSAISQMDIESRRHPSLKRAVASTRVD